MTDTKEQDIVLWLSDSRGVYIPRDFAKSFIDRDKSVRGVTAEQWDILDIGPDHEHYWETWDEVLAVAMVIDDKAVGYKLHQDGDLWLVPAGMEWDHDNDCYAWPKD